MIATSRFIMDLQIQIQSALEAEFHKSVLYPVLKCYKIYTFQINRLLLTH